MRATSAPEADTSPGRNRPAAGLSRSLLSIRVLRMLRLSMLPVGCTLLAGWIVLLALSGLENSDLAGNASQSVAFVAFLVVGTMIVAHQPHNLVGWICTTIGFAFLYMSFAEAFTVYAYELHPQGLPLREVVAWTTMFSWAPAVMLPLTLLLLLFPTGRPPTRRWRFVAWYALAVLLLTIVRSALVDDQLDPLQIEERNPFGVATLDPVLKPAGSLLEFMLLVSFVLCAAGALWRFRSATGIERLQMKWFAYAVLASFFLLLANDLLTSGSSNVFFGIALTLIAVSIGASVLRYRLYDIDRLINRTIVYAVLSAGLAAVYFALVVGLQEVLRPLSGGSDLAIVVTTLVVAAVALPARRRIQVAVDRRFNRRTYNASQTIDAFSGRLRDEIDLDTLRYELLAVVHDTMQPATASLWLRTAQENRA